MRLYTNASLCLLFILAACCVGQAQSGRRAPKPLSPPTTTPLPKESEQPPTQSKPAVSRQTLIAGMDSSLSIPLYMSDAVWSGFIDRFNKVSSVVISADKSMNRKEASERAKKQTENFVVFIQLTTTDVNTGLGQVYLDNLVVSYSIFSPATGKVKENGQVYVHSSRSILSKRLPTGRAGEAQLNDAGRETADRVMALLHIGNTAGRP